jgi:hypothetical protein
MDPCPSPQPTSPTSLNIFKKFNWKGAQFREKLTYKESFGYHPSQERARPGGQEPHEGGKFS